jgi:hypothetical protein
MLRVPVAVTLVAAAIVTPVAALAQFAQTAKTAEDVQITHLERLSTSADEDHPCVSGDGLSFYFASNPQGNFNLVQAVRRVRTQPFTNPKLIEELAGKGDDVSPFSPGREPGGSEYLYFAAQRDTKNLDIYFARRLKPDEPFLRLAIAPVHAVCTEADECHPCVNVDEKSMYFSRKTAEGWRVGYAHGTDRRAFDKVELLDLPVGLCHPSLSRDGLAMYLHGPVEQGKEKLGIFVCRRATRTAKWGEPKPVEPLNHKDSQKGDCSPRLSPDGMFLYFASDRPGGKGGLDLYAVPMADLK